MNCRGPGINSCASLTRQARWIDPPTRDTNTGRVTNAADRCKFQKGRSDEEDTILRAFADRQSPDARVCGTARRALARGEGQRVVWQAAMAGPQQLHFSPGAPRTRDVAGPDQCSA